MDIGSTKISETTEELIKLGVVPRFGLFDITEEMLRAYHLTYNKIHNKVAKKYDRTYSRRIAGLMLLNLKIHHRGGSPSNCKEGLVYFIENPAYTDYYKVGITVSLDKRLATYQTGSPFRDYSVAKYEFCLDRKAVENQILTSDKVSLAKGEWIKKENADSLFISICRTQSNLQIRGTLTLAKIKNVHSIRRGKQSGVAVNHLYPGAVPGDGVYS